MVGFQLSVFAWKNFFFLGRNIPHSREMPRVDMTVWLEIFLVSLWESVKLFLGDLGGLLAQLLLFGQLLFSAVYQSLGGVKA